MWNTILRVPAAVEGEGEGEGDGDRDSGGSTVRL